MSKRDNKRFNDKERKGAPKRGGKNRRDYGDFAMELVADIFAKRH